MPEQPIFIRSLIVRQGQLSDRAFARKLGISHMRWAQIRSGEPPGLQFIRAALAVYPDLALEAAALLMPESDSMLSTTAKTEVSA